MSDAQEIARLERKHRDIALLGAGALIKQQQREAHQEEMTGFALDHQLVCFKCGTTFNDWAKTGTTNGRHWAICALCVRKPREA